MNRFGLKRMVRHAVTLPALALVALPVVLAWQLGTTSPATAQDKKGAAKTKVNPKDGLTYVWIEPGTFQMGCSMGDTNCSADENPAHQVTLTKGFWIGQTAVTQGAYMKVTGNNPSNFKGDDKLPVEKVSWADANKFCQSVDMRLPTEAEWEYAARGGTSGPRYGEVDAIGWDTDNSGEKTHDVGQKQPNAYGLYDMLGNVWQWVGDFYQRYPDGAQTDPKGPAMGTARILRGGSWKDVATFIRASYRNGSMAGFRIDDFGVRCAGD
jgi:formylglycine-generating enzyme required for sulfatase activity